MKRTNVNLLIDATAFAGFVSIGAWLSGLVGLDYPDQRLLKFENAIQEGEFLMLVDAPEDRVRAIQEIVLEPKLSSAVPIQHCLR